MKGGMGPPEERKMSDDSLYLNIEKLGANYFWVLAHPEAIMATVGEGKAKSISGAIRCAFQKLAVGERVCCLLIMSNPGADNYEEVGETSAKRAWGWLQKGSESPDYEKAAQFMLGRIQ